VIASGLALDVRAAKSEKAGAKRLVYRRGGVACGESEITADF